MSASNDITLPALTGSEKQVAWATDIRAGAVRQFAQAEAIYTALRDELARNPAIAPAFDAYIAARHELLANGDARAFIDARDALRPVSGVLGTGDEPGQVRIEDVAVGEYTRGMYLPKPQAVQALGSWLRPFAHR